MLSIDSMPPSRQRCEAERTRVRLLAVLLASVALLVLACAPPARTPGAPPSPRPDDAVDHVVRVALRTGAPSAVISSSGAWRIEPSGSAAVRMDRGEQLAVRADRDRLVVTDATGRERFAGASATVSNDGTAFLVVDGRRYRGQMVVYAHEGSVLVVNRLPLEEYLRGVVPLEIGPRSADERAAVEAQAITARSYARVRIRPEVATRYDLVGTVMHQVYGGADAEIPISDDAIRATRGLVLTFANRIVDAVYHSTCGGSTAAASEVWRSGDQPYLQAVSDRIPGTARYYCDISPRFRWTRVFTHGDLSTALQRYLHEYAAVGSGGPGRPVSVSIDGHTSSGRVRAIVIATDRGRYSLRGNDMRFVLRDSGGAILGSTYFSLENETERGALTRLTILGSGFGHGIGMCQWGAIGRARAGQDARAILEAYYPGTRVGLVK